MSQLTRKAIMKCTLELAEKKSLKKITVKDIADECGITRSTFYYHFSDIYDVLDGVVQAKIDEFNEEYNGEMDKVLMRFIEYSIIHRKVWANLFDAGTAAQCNAYRTGPPSRFAPEQRLGNFHRCRYPQDRRKERTPGIPVVGILCPTQRRIYRYRPAPGA